MRERGRGYNKIEREWKLHRQAAQTRNAELDPTNGGGGAATNNSKAEHYTFALYLPKWLQKPSAK